MRAAPSRIDRGVPSGVARALSWHECARQPSASSTGRCAGAGSTRRGHDVDALLFGDLPVGLLDHSTGDQINFLRTDPPLLWRRCDAAWIAGVTAACVAGFALLSWPWLLVGVPAVVLRTGLAVSVRMLWRWSIRAKVDAALAAAARAAQPRPRLRRVK